jgi:outer membrane murein-binding lipoprotein Lpp
VLTFGLQRATLLVAGCILLSLAFVGHAETRDAKLDEARSEVRSQNVQARKRRAAQVKRKASVEEEPFCVRPFEYPRKAR